MSWQKRIVLVFSCLFLFNNCAYFYWKPQIIGTTTNGRGEEVPKYSYCVTDDEYISEPALDVARFILSPLGILPPRILSNVLLIGIGMPSSAIAIFVSLPISTIALPFVYPFLPATGLSKQELQKMEQERQKQIQDKNDRDIEELIERQEKLLEKLDKDSSTKEK